MSQKFRFLVVITFVFLLASTALRQPFDGAQDKAQDTASSCKISTTTPRSIGASSRAMCPT